MAEAIVMPKMGLTMEEGTVTTWLVEKGAALTAGQPVVEIETYKATMDLESPIDGVLLDHIDARSVVPVGTIIAIVGDPAETIDVELGTILTSATGADTGEAEGVSSVDAPPAAPGQPGASRRERDGRSISPAARSRARELGVDVRAVEGTGPGGRVRVEDVERAAQPNRRGD